MFVEENSNGELAVYDCSGFALYRGIVDGQGNVYVGDNDGSMSLLFNRIQQFSSSGAFRGTWSSFTAPVDGRVINPRGLAVGFGNLYVADYGSGRLLVFGIPSFALPRPRCRDLLLLQ
jgi:hypothetical protein